MVDSANLVVYSNNIVEDSTITVVDITNIVEDRYEILLLGLRLMLDKRAYFVGVESTNRMEL